jgi:hypothetical protein
MSYAPSLGFYTWVRSVKARGAVDAFVIPD